MNRHETGTGTRRAATQPCGSAAAMAVPPLAALQADGLAASFGARGTTRRLLFAPARRALKRWPGLLLALVLPLVLLLLNENWVITNPLNPPWFDPFVYQSLFMHLREGISAHPDYYPATRIPWIALGAAFYSVLPPVAANLALKLALFATTVGLVFTALRRLTSAGPAAAATLLLATYPYFVMATGWDYSDGLIFALLAVCYVGAAHGARRPGGWRTGEFALGAAFASMVACNLFTVVFAAPLALFYLGVLLSGGEAWRGRAISKQLARAVLGAGLGLLTGLAALSALSWLLGGDPLVLKAQIQTALALADPNQNKQWKFESWTHLATGATWLAAPIATCLVALGAGAVAAVRIRRRGRTRDDVLMLCVALHYLAAFGIFAWSTVTTAAVLLFWFYTGYLIVPMFVTLGCAFAYVGRRTSLPLWPWAAAAIALLAVHSSFLAPWLQQILTFELHPAPSVTTTIWVADGIGILLLAWRYGLLPLAVPGAAALGIGYLSMMSSLPQLFGSEREDRVSAFRALIDASEQVAALSGHPRRYVWIDRTEQPYGLLYHSIWIRTVPLSRNWGVGFEFQNRFPSLPDFEFEAGDPVVIFTTRRDWREAANESLTNRGLALEDVQVRQVSHGGVSFQAIQAKIAKAGPPS